jgi:hypothetical protein
MTPAHVLTCTDASALSPEVVADSFELLARERAWMEQELDEISSAKPSLSRASFERLSALCKRLEPAVSVRERLTSQDPATLQAGVAVWLARHPAPSSTASVV